MKKLAIVITIAGIMFIPQAASQPEITHTDFYQADLTHGEMITFGVQFEGPGDVTHAMATLRNGGKEVDYTPLLDRNGDDFYAGELGEVKGGNTYQVEIKGCNTSNECTTETFNRHASYTSFW